jgi:hypothetical protein
MTNVRPTPLGITVPTDDPAEDVVPLRKGWYDPDAAAFDDDHERAGTDSAALSATIVDGTAFVDWS